MDDPLPLRDARMPDVAARRVVDQPALWRADIISDFRLRGEERCAAASPSYGFPRLLDHVVDEADGLPPGPVLVVGGGLGGVASWLGRQTRRAVISVDISASSVAAAGRLFPELHLAVADGAHLPLADASTSAVIATGVVSVSDDVAGIVRDAHRVLVPDGALIVADLWSATSAPHHGPTNRFRPLREFDAECARHGFPHEHWAVCHTSVGWWSTAADEVEQELERRHGDDERLVEHRRNRRLIRTEIHSGRLLAAAGTFRKRVG